MAVPPPSATHTTNLLTTHRALHDTFTSFLTVWIHHTLYLRRLYPRVSFLTVRAYNYPVRQSRHPAVASWINDAVSAVRHQLEKSTISKIAICIYECDHNAVLERWTLDLNQFPTTTAGEYKRERDVPFSRDQTVETNGESGLRRKVNVADLEAQFRATLSRLNVVGGKLKALPEGPGAPEYSFTLTMEVKDEADRPVGRLEEEERKWVAAEPEDFERDEELDSEVGTDGERLCRGRGKKQRSGKTVPIRRLEAGELRLEMWVEESKAKFDLLDTTGSTGTAFGSQEQIAGQHSSDFQIDFDLEPADVNRKPQGGAFTDYKR